MVRIAPGIGYAVPLVVELSNALGRGPAQAPARKQALSAPWMPPDAAPHA